MSRLASRLRGGTSEAAREGFQRGRELGAEGWDVYPLLIGGLALLGGAAVAMLLPPTAAEDKLMGKTADRVNRRIKDVVDGALGGGKGVFTKALDGAIETAAREAEREGLTPTRLGRKVKRLASQVRRAVADAIE